MKPRAKEAVAFGLLVLFGGTLWLTLSVLLPKLSWDETSLIVRAIISTLLLFVVWGFIAMTVVDAFWVTVAWATVSFGGLIWFYGFPFLIISTILFLAGIIGFFRARSQIQKTLEGGIMRPLRRVLPLTATVLAAAIAVAAYQAAPPASLDVRALVPEYLFVRVLTGLESTIKSITPQIKLDEATLHSLYIVSVDFLEKQAAAYKHVFLIAYTIGFFATLRFFGIFLYLVSILLTSLLLRVLRKFGIVQLRSVQRNFVTYSLS